MSDLGSSMRGRGRWLAVTLGGLVLLVGCGRGGGPAGSASPADELQRAARATLASASFVIHIGISGADGETTVVYQAPDRVHRTDGGGGFEMITIGRIVFARHGSLPPSLGAADTAVPSRQGAAPGTFQRIEAPGSGPGPVDGTLAELRTLANAGRVERDGARFHWRAGSGRSVVSGDARIDGGRIADFTFRPADPAWTMGATTYRITDYDAAPAVDPPPANQVVNAPAMTPCGPDGSPPPGQTVCGTWGMTWGFTGPPTTTAVVLPTPTITGPSPLELRRVLSVQDGPCPAPADKPGPDDEVRLGGEGHCYRVGPTLATIRRATTHPEAAPDGITVAVALSAADGAAMRAALAGQVGHQVAMVMFDRVLSAATVHDASYTLDTMAISSLDPQTAANVVRSLGG